MSRNERYWTDPQTVVYLFLQPLSELFFPGSTKPIEIKADTAVVIRDNKSNGIAHIEYGPGMFTKMLHHKYGKVLSLRKQSLNISIKGHQIHLSFHIDDVKAFASQFKTTEETLKFLTDEINKLDDKTRIDTQRIKKALTIATTPCGISIDDITLEPQQLCHKSF